MQSNNKKEVIEGLTRVLAFFLICLFTALIGGSGSPGWLIAFLPVALGGFAYWISDKGGKYAAFGFGIGLVASLLYVFFGV